MFKIGDKVVCVNSKGQYVSSHGSLLREGEIYIIEKILLSDSIYIIIINGIEYNSKRFITIEEGRRLKLNKIMSKI